MNNDYNQFKNVITAAIIEGKPSPTLVSTEKCPPA